MAKNVTSAGHKLGQMIGNFFEGFFSEKFTELAEGIGEGSFYCDKRGLRPRVRRDKKKVSWRDEEGNLHDLDYVFERDGSSERQGEPAAFIELAWRRYTKHSRNKAGEIQAALIPLKNTYRNTCNFAGVILAGEFTDGAITQLKSNGLNVLYIPYSKIVKAFLTKGINLDYPEDASNEHKQAIIDSCEALSVKDVGEIESVFEEMIKEDYDDFINSLKESLLRKIEKIAVYPLYAEKMVFFSPEDAISVLEELSLGSDLNTLKFCKFEIYIKFSNGDRIEGSFHRKEEAINFLKIYE